jgi:L-ascorbate metabolism protein UlaG (beta-lactamase superfamily)
MKLTWYGHATWLLDVGTHKLLIDPFFDHNPASPVKAADVTANYILVSHGHEDHMADAASIANRCSATILANFEIASWFARQHGVKHTIGMNLGGAVKLPFGRVKLTLAFHSSTLPDGSAGGNPGGFVVEAGGQRVYFACDTALFSDMQLIGRGGLAAAVLPIGDLFTMGPDDAVAAVKLLQSKKVFPSHFNTWPPIDQDAPAWAERVRQETSAEPILLQPGESASIEVADAQT